MLKLDKESKRILPYFLIVFVMILLTSGPKKGLIAIAAILFSGAVIVAAVWLIAFLIVCILLGSIKKVWIEANPMAIIKELRS